MSAETTSMAIDPHEGVSAELVEYLIVAVPTVDSLPGLAPVLTELVHRALIRILDAVVLVKDVDGTVTALELDAVDSMTAVRDLNSYLGDLLSQHDVALASTALRSGSVGVVVVIEDRWAKRLSIEAQRVGGQIISGDRIPAERVKSAFAARTHDQSAG